jgi:hypothetical protein
VISDVTIVMAGLLLLAVVIGRTVLRYRRDVREERVSVAQAAVSGELDVRLGKLEHRVRELGEELTRISLSRR